MLGVYGSKHWAEDMIYHVLQDGNFHTFDEIHNAVIQNGYMITRNNLSTVLHRLKKKNGDFVRYKVGLYIKISKNIPSPVSDE